MVDPVKDAFDKVRQDIDSINRDIYELSKGVVETRNQMSELCEIIKSLFEKVEKIAEKQDRLSEKQHKQQENYEKLASTHNTLIPTPSTHPSTLPQEIGGLKPQNLGISTGNEGVPTDRQTHQQTDISTHFTRENPDLPAFVDVNKASEILASLDSIKKEVRLKVKRLTEQEWLIFSTIYQLEEQNLPIDYKTLAKRLKLTESSIRDYVGRIIKKGLPVDKNKINNKTIQLSISPNLKKIASLSTVMQLRGI